MGRESGGGRVLCKCSLKSTCRSTLSQMILTCRSINSVKQISVNDKGPLWGLSVPCVEECEELSERSSC